MTKSPLLALAAPISRKTSCSWWKERRSSTTRKDEHPTATSLQVFGIREQLDEQQARDETTDMRPDRHPALRAGDRGPAAQDRKSTRLNSSHGYISYAVFCLKKKKKTATVEHCAPT